MVIIFIDFHHQIIPDVISLPGMAVGFLASFFNALVTWQQSALGILFGYGILFSIPLVGLICLIVFSFNDTNINRRNYARSYFIVLLIAVVLLVILAFAGVLGGLWVRYR